MEEIAVNIQNKHCLHLQYFDYANAIVIDIFFFFAQAITFHGVYDPGSGSAN